MQPSLPSTFKPGDEIQLSDGGDVAQTVGSEPVQANTTTPSPRASCSAVLHLTMDELDDVLCAALQDLPFVETTAEECANAKGA
jgi:hypothetical protein